MNASDAMHAATFRISRDHASLPGHFPGRPIVPGVVLLDLVLDEAERWLGPVTVSGAPHVKFTAALLPEEDARMELRLAGDELRFSIVRGQSAIAQGSLRIATGSRA